MLENRSGWDESWLMKDCELLPWRTPGDFSPVARNLNPARLISSQRGQPQPAVGDRVQRSRQPCEMFSFDHFITNARKDAVILLF